MEQDIFRAGVRPGSPTTVDEIKILICYILSKTIKPISFSQIHEALSENEFVNYFDLVSAVDALEESGHIERVAQQGRSAGYIASKLGLATAGETNGLIPVSVRDKAVSSAELLLRREKRESEVKAEIIPNGKGFSVSVSIPADGAELIAISVFCPTCDEAELVRKRFLNDPAYIYKGVLALLTGDKDVIGEMFESREQLF